MQSPSLLLRIARAGLSFSLFVIASSSCTPGGIGDPCLPHQPLLAHSNDPQCAADAGCFLGSEIYVETRSVQCRTRVCMVNHWDQQAMPDQRSADAYCTCRCAGPGDPSTLCRCPEGFVCSEVFTSGPEAVQGNYCVRRPTP
jgi:hypothetical protein